MEKRKYKYRTIKDSYNNDLRYKCWMEDLIDEDTGTIVAIERKQAIKFNGVDVRFYRSHELKYMTKKQKDAIKL